MISAGIKEIDTHGLRTAEAVSAVTRAVHQAGPDVYRVRVIHGYHGGTAIKDAILDEFSYGRDSKVKRVEPGSNQGETDLILRELF